MRRQTALAALGLVALTACSSPNRGTWQGTFEGGVRGEMVFEINTRGTAAEGDIEGTTGDGQSFKATFEGSLNVDYLKADFEGGSNVGLGLPDDFEGSLDGTLTVGRAEGKWQVEIIQTRTHFEGTWTATQTVD